MIAVKHQITRKSASVRRLRALRGISSNCYNRVFRQNRKHQRFCGQQCKETFFKVKYGLLTLAPYFNVQLTQGPKIDG